MSIVAKRSPISATAELLFQTATKSVQNTTLSRLLSVETAVCVTNVVTQVTDRLSLNIW